MAPIYTNFEGERAPKNAIFLSKFFKKCPKTAFLTVFSKICLRRRKFSQNRGKTVLWESSKNQFGRPKKKGSQNFGKFFENPPPLEKILDPPLTVKLIYISGLNSLLAKNTSIKKGILFTVGTNLPFVFVADLSD